MKSDKDIIHSMLKYGGSFASAIARAAACADEDNLRRLKTAFPELWERYSQMDELPLSPFHESSQP